MMQFAMHMVGLFAIVIGPVLGAAAPSPKPMFFGVAILICGVMLICAGAVIAAIERKRPTG